MEPIHYFAYGSNMLRERLLDRAVALLDDGQPAHVRGYRLTFNKASKDGSAKANLMADATATTWGVLLTVDAASLTGLDAAEGAPNDYRQASIAVETQRGAVQAMTYLAQSHKILTVPDRPYDWYLALILVGAQSHAHMPSEWITHLRKVGEPKRDTETPARKTFTDAVAQLKAAGHHQWEQLLTDTSGR